MQSPQELVSRDGSWWHLPDPQVLLVGGTGTKKLWECPALLFLWFLGLHMVCAPVLQFTPGFFNMFIIDFCFLVAKLCLTLCNSIDCSPPGSSVHGISQARILEWLAISFSRGSSPIIDTHCCCCCFFFKCQECSAILAITPDNKQWMLLA